MGGSLLPHQAARTLKANVEHVVKGIQARPASVQGSTQGADSRITRRLRTRTMTSLFRPGGFFDGRRVPRTRLDELTMQVRYYAASRWCVLSGIANGLPVPPPRLTWLVADHFMVVRS